MARGDRLASLVNKLAERPAMEDRTYETYPRMVEYLASLPPEEARKWQRPIEGSWMTMHPLEFKGITEDGQAQMAHATTHWNERLKIAKHMRTLEFKLTPGDVARTLRSYARHPISRSSEPHYQLLLRLQRLPL